MIDRFARVPVLAAVLGCAAAEGPPPASENTAPPPPTDRIGVAMTAAPASVSGAATIMDIDSTGAMVQLRAGTNGWVCLPDENPVAEGDAPICIDGPWQQWLEAYSSKTAPAISSIGVSYMLQGGPAASNTDPFAEEPPDGQSWLHDGPHMMVIVPDPAMLAGYPTEHGTGLPYVMWSGTPYAHLMIPISAH